MMDQRLLKEAVDWFVRMHDGPPSAATKTQFTEWLLLSPEHIRAFLDVTQSLESLKNVSLDLDRETLIANATKDRAASNVVSLEGIAHVPPGAAPRDRQSRIKPWWVAGIALGLLSAGALCGWLACDQWHHSAHMHAEGGS